MQHFTHFKWGEEGWRKMRKILVSGREKNAHSTAINHGEMGGVDELEKNPSFV